MPEGVRAINTSKALTHYTLMLVAFLLAACGTSVSQPPPGDTAPADGLLSTAAPFIASPRPATQQPTAEPAPTGTPEPTSLLSPASLTLGFEPVASGFDDPVVIASAGDGSGRLFVGSQRGVIFVIEDGVLLPDPFLNIRERIDSSQLERGLLGVAFHPNYASNGYFYVDYTDKDGNTVVARFSVTSDPHLADPGSEKVILRQVQPARNHNGGHLAFGPDGYLYIGLGDGGGSDDTYGNGQNTRTWLGAMLRIDVDGGDPYTVPPDNPYANAPDVENEIWVYGLRNPWRFSFDRQTGDLYIADVGQGAYEEINFLRAGYARGQNYGWPITEGAHCFKAPDGCDTNDLTFPVAEYTHDNGCSITGGYVYRGAAQPALDGVYLYGDWCSGNVWGLVVTPDGIAQAQLLAQTDFSISTFGEGNDGELYLADQESGTLYHIVTR